MPLGFIQFLVIWQHLHIDKIHKNEFISYTDQPISFPLVMIWCFTSLGII